MKKAKKIFSRPELRPDMKKFKIFLFFYHFRLKRKQELICHDIFAYLGHFGQKGQTINKEINFVAFEALLCDILCFGLCLVFLTLMISKSKNMMAHKFLVPFEPKKLKKF